MGSRAGIVELSASVTPATNDRRGYLILTLLCVGHFTVDLYSSALAVFQPILADRLGNTLTQAGILGGLMVFSGSVLQPVYGYLSDRVRTRLFAALGPAVAGLFIAALGLSPSFLVAMALVALGGAGIAAFHPQASSSATAALARHRGRWMAVFISSGGLGLAAGPTYFSAVIGWTGVERSYWAALPGLVIAALLVAALPDLPRRRKTASHFDWPALGAVWQPLLTLYLLVFIRSIVQVVFAQFLTLYLRNERGFPLNQASWALSLYLGFGAFGGLLGGQLADRFGGRRIILLSMIGSAPFLALFLFGSGIPALAGLVLSGLILLSTGPVNVVMAQELVPSQAGTVSALMMGFAWGAAGFLFIPLTGWASDLFSLHAVLTSFLAFPILGFFLSLKLPK